jgi:hypothetical protein
MSCQKPKNSDYRCPVEANFCNCQEGYEFGGAGWTCPYLKQGITLKLTVKKKWFDKIRSGEKPFEYREYKSYWIKRLVDRDYDFIEFRNGYKKDSPKIITIYKGYKIIEGIKTPLGSMKQFGIRIGELVK